MKANTLILVTCISLACPAVAAETWDIARNTLYTKPSHVWQNLDGSKTYRTDLPGRTVYDQRSAQSVIAESQFNQELAVLAICAVIAGVRALCDWLNTPVNTGPGTNR
jgi:hypothetical protein